MATQKKNLEVVESTGAAGKSDPNRVKKYFRLEVNRRKKQLFCYIFFYHPAKILFIF